METVYIETSVVSYLAALPSHDPVVAWRQKLTRAWWTNQREKFLCFVSQEVIVEIVAGNPGAAARRKAAIENLPLLAMDNQTAKLAKDLMAHGLLPPNARADASHLAASICAEMDYLLTWNYRHLANAVVLHHMESFLERRGLKLPRVCTPEELMGE